MATYFETHGNQGAGVIHLPITATGTQIRLDQGALQELGNPTYLQVSNEVVQVEFGGGVLAPLTVATLTAALNPGDTTLTVDSSNLFSASQALGRIDRVTVSGDTMTVTDVLSGTTVAVTRDDPTLTRASGSTVTWSAENRPGTSFPYRPTFHNINRGQVGTVAAAYPRLTAFARLYLPTDFVAAATDLPAYLYLGATAVGVVRLPRHLVALKSRHHQEYVRIPIVAGTVLRGRLLGTAPLVNYTVDIEVTRLADEFGTPIAPSAPWRANFDYIYASAQDVTRWEWYSSDAASTFCQKSADNTGIELLQGGTYAVYLDHYKFA